MLMGLPDDDWAWIALPGDDEKSLTWL